MAETYDKFIQINLPYAIYDASGNRLTEIYIKQTVDVDQRIAERDKKLEEIAALDAEINFKQRVK